MLILGIDDAGRGPVIGPMVLAGVLINEKQEAKLKKHDVRDSKQIHNSHMAKFAEIVKDNCLVYKIVKSSPSEIDSYLLGETNLNEVEAIKSAFIVNEINEKFKNEKIKLIVDCPSNNIFAWRSSLIKKIKNKDNLEIHCEHKADVNHIAVGAASILAKATREQEMEKIQKQYENLGKVGSGYASDPITQEFLKEHGKELRNSGMFRKTWQTWKSLFPEAGQATLEGF